MNNYSITNLSLPTDSNDAVNKKFIIGNTSYVHLFGTVDSNGYFVHNVLPLIRLNKVSIVMITIFSSTSFNNIRDTLKINHLSSTERSYNFIHASIRRFVSIDISHKLERITDIALQNGRNLPFIIVYKTLYI